MKRLILALVLLCVIAVPQVSAQTSSASILFTSEQSNTSTNEIFTTELEIDTAGAEVGGVGAKIKFDPTYLQIDKIETLPVFPDYPATTFDNEKGTAVISGIVKSKDALYSGKAPFATITWKAKSAGSTPIELLYQPNETKDSNIAVLYGTGDILSKVNSVLVNIDGSTTNETALSADPLPPVETEIPRTTQVKKSWLDLTPEWGILFFFVLANLSALVYLYYRVHLVEKKLESHS